MKLKMTILFAAALIMMQPVLMRSVAHAQGAASKLEVRYDNQRLYITARNADIKYVLSRLASATNIKIEYPVTLKKSITMKKRGLSVNEALKRMLKGINYVIFYSGPDLKQAKINRVLVLTKAERRKPQSTKDRQLAARISAYQRQIDSLKRRLANMDANSVQAKRYLNRISRLEKSIERIE